MPVIEQSNLNAAPIEGDEEQRSSNEGELLFDTNHSSQQSGGYKSDLLDLMGLGGEAVQPIKSESDGASKQQNNKIFDFEDLLGGLPSSGGKAPPNPAPKNQADPFADFFESNGGTVDNK